ncbi:MAG: hypothetical protein WC477_02460 [Patescibacteria group bacterium]
MLRSINTAPTQSQSTTLPNRDSGIITTDEMLWDINAFQPDSLTTLLATLLRGEAKLTNVEFAKVLGNTATQDGGVPREMKIFTFSDGDTFVHAYRDRKTLAILPKLDSAFPQQDEGDEIAPQGTTIACTGHDECNVLYTIRTPVQNNFAHRYELRYWMLDGSDPSMTRTYFFQTAGNTYKFLSHAKHALGKRIFLTVARRPKLD